MIDSERDKHYKTWISQTSHGLQFTEYFLPTVIEYTSSANAL